MDAMLLVVGFVAFNAGFIFGAFWVSAKQSEAPQRDEGLSSALGRD